MSFYQGLFQQFLPLSPMRKKSFAFIFWRISRFLHDHLICDNRFGIRDESLVRKIIDQPARTVTIHTVICCGVSQCIIAGDKNRMLRSGKNQNGEIVIRWFGISLHQRRDRAVLFRIKRFKT
ncbi:MAG: hypothetical protein CVV32_00440 [Methanomicrobiales archaeon HGW-Methanomicrobiales-3]|nr:MAG: hypothetical protein CVV32_00440 [Methanomicrobiales archaeon HGW-Methanomicrobiales-3]